MKNKTYFYLDSELDIIEEVFIQSDIFDKKRKEVGNYFETKKEAQKARNKVKDLLLGL